MSRLFVDPEVGDYLMTSPPAPDERKALRAFARRVAKKGLGGLDTVLVGSPQQGGGIYLTRVGGLIVELAVTEDDIVITKIFPDIGALSAAPHKS